MEIQMSILSDIAQSFLKSGVNESGYSKVVDHYSFVAIYDYLYKIYSGKLVDEKIDVFNAMGIKNLSDPCLMKILPEFQIAGIYSFSEAYSYLFVKYETSCYIVNLLKEIDFTIHPVTIYHRITILGMDNNANSSLDLFMELKRKAFQNSGLKNQIIEIQNKNFVEDILNNIQIKVVPTTTLDKIFLSDRVEFHIKRMVYEIMNYSNGKKSLRYLLNGEPGTGKTQVISSIINQIYGKITTVVIKGTDYNFHQIFDFCSALEPCLLVVDDLDFIAKDRNNSPSNGQLNDLLHVLDGIFSTSIFLLAATNDKKLVDIAASRPGRFDLIMDFGYLSKRNYLQLIKRETNDKDIISLFEEDILQIMSEKKITGAFLVNLLKQMKSIKNMKKELNHNDLIDLISFSYDGFYNTNEKMIQNIVGF
jgi:ATPase family associated with various cellular activities (AAA)